ncbi:MAG: hypothetical protein HWE27_08590 [Gammaproteobacteria bacterium]|nr:hypothetical protein [Gammaproteobacteria bacterium]
MTSETPYSAPNASLNESGALLNSPVDILKCSAGQGATWFIDGIKSTFRNPISWGLIGLINFGLLLLTLIISLIPIIGSFIPSLFYPIIVAGFMVASYNQDNGTIRAKDLFAGFSRNTGQLFLNGALYIAMTIGIFIIAFILFLGLFFAFFSTLQSQDKDVTIILLATVGVLIFLGLLLPAIMAIWFAPALIILFDIDAVEAIKYSFKGCARNFVPYIIYSLVAMLIMIIFFAFLAGLSFIVSPGVWQGEGTDVGFWVTLAGGYMVMAILFAPIFFNSIYQSFKDIYRLKSEPKKTDAEANISGSTKDPILN